MLGGSRTKRERERERRSDNIVHFYQNAILSSQNLRVIVGTFLEHFRKSVSLLAGENLAKPESVFVWNSVEKE